MRATCETHSVPPSNNPNNQPQEDFRHEPSNNTSGDKHRKRQPDSHAGAAEGPGSLRLRFCPVGVCARQRLDDLGVVQLRV